MHHPLLPILLVVLPVFLQASLPSVPPDPELPYQAERRDPVTYDVDLGAVVTPPSGAKVLRIWMPVPPSDGAQRVEGTAFETWPENVEPKIAAEPLFGNRFAYFEFREPKGAQMIRHRFRITVHELRFHVDPAKVEPLRAWPESFQRYLRSESQSVVIGDEVRKLAGAAGDLPSVLDWIHANLKYDHSRASLQASSQWALEKRAGHCSDYHALCSAMTRALGYPARVTYGINPFPKSSPSHCKAEVFLPGHGWVSFDISETQKLIERIAKDDTLEAARKRALVDAARRRLLSGFRDNTWFLQTRGTDYDLAPPASRKVAVVRTIYAEADGEPLPEPDPGDPMKREFAWMTLHSFKPDHPVADPFTDLKSLETEK
jgi:transglutaminase-like putative cysteine protease